LNYLSEEQMLKTLAGLGLSRLDFQVYIRLAKKGPQKGRDLLKGLGLQKQLLYRSLKALQSKGIVHATLEYPATFSAVSFDKVVDIFIKTKISEAQLIQESKEELLAYWKTIPINQVTDEPSKFNILSGRGPIYAKILQMIKEANNQILTISTIAGLVQASLFGSFDDVTENQGFQKISFRSITANSTENIYSFKKFLMGLNEPKINFEGRILELNLKLPQLIIRDEAEILFFIEPFDEISQKGWEDTCLWTNCKSLVQAFVAVFNDFWEKSIDVNSKIDKFEHQRIEVRRDQYSEDNKMLEDYIENLFSAEKEVIILASSNELIELSENKDLLVEWRQKNLSVNIMAPIESHNIDVASELSMYFGVRHIPLGYLSTTIIDRNKLYQFERNLKSGHAKPKDEIFTTNNIAFIEKTRAILNDIWEKAVFAKNNSQNNQSKSFSPIVELPKALLKTNGATIRDKGQEPEISEKYILDKMINYQKNPPKKDAGQMITFGSAGQAVIRPPEEMSLPEIKFSIFHCNKYSTYGASDSFLIDVWTETSKGGLYVASAFVTDNLRSIKFWEKFLSGMPAAQNIKLMKKDFLKIGVAGNTLFAAWAVPIRILQSIDLPPSCILVEGTGKVKPSRWTFSLPSGYIFKTECNNFDAFVTYYNPASKYSGPGTDGVFGRDVISQFHEPKQ
jgi:sugar-specific transcriptional regulator TrmB